MFIFEVTEVLWYLQAYTEMENQLHFTNIVLLSKIYSVHFKNTVRFKLFLKKNNNNSSDRKKLAFCNGTCILFLHHKTSYTFHSVKYLKALCTNTEHKAPLCLS